MQCSGVGFNSPATSSIIGGAQKFYRLHGQDLARLPWLAGVLEPYREAIAATAGLTRSLGIPAICNACAARNAECCFDGVQARYDDYLITTNLLLGCVLTGAGPEKEGCHFCGPQGCCLIAKVSFCLNYFCGEVKAALGPAGMKSILTQVGLELQCQWELDRMLLPWFWSQKS